MKKLVTANDIKKKYDKKENILYIDNNTLVTPAAKDAAEELNIEIKMESEKVEDQTPEKKNECKESKTMADVVIEKGKEEGLALNQELISRIVSEVLKSITMNGMIQPQIQKECDPSGIRLVRGQSVVCEKFDTGKPGDKVGIKEILTRKESPNMATGFMTLEDTAFDWTLRYDEVDYIVEGTLDIIIDGKTYSAHQGDVIFIPKDTSITFSTPDSCKFFFATYPANWAELSANGNK